jgi:NAD(P)-dependent dehydrogenase (short-subunit alcohol dehydrogenase family)
MSNVLQSPSNGPSVAAITTFEMRGRLAVITGAGSGIGRATAIALGRCGASLCLIGRDADKLALTAAGAQHDSPPSVFQYDLGREQDYKELVAHVREAGHLDLLVHSAGVIHQQPIESARIEEFDQQYATNVRAPFLLTQRLLPFLTASCGQVVFINSSAGLSASSSDVTQYAATKHALRAVADGFRMELNPKGVRVLSVYLGRTATPMQVALYQQQNHPYRPEDLLQPEDVAQMVITAVQLPRNSEVTEICMRPMRKTY